MGEGLDGGGAAGGGFGVAEGVSVRSQRAWRVCGERDAYAEWEGGGGGGVCDGR